MGNDRNLAARRLEAALNALTEGMVVTDAQGRVAEINPAAERLTSWRRADALGRPYQEVLQLSAVGGNAGANALEHHNGHAPAVASEWMLVARDSRRLLVSLRVSEVQGADGFALAFSDITEQSLLAQDRTFRATHDALTGLLNRDEFARRVSMACTALPQPGNEHLVAILDLDQFQLINDKLGYAAGDKMLREIAAEFRSRLRASDLLARLGSDEFGVLLLDCTPEDAQALLNSLLETARAHRLSWDGQSLATTVSIGATRITGASANHEARLLSLVDTACFAAKDAGRNRIQYLDADQAPALRSDEMNVAAHLSSALDEERFALCSQDATALDQPQRVVYRELLLRLRHERGELILPHRFIPAAEHYFLMNAIDRWVVHKALQQIAARPADDVIHAINVSGQSIADPNFLRFVLRTVEASGLDPARICFEIAENVAVTRLTEVAGFMEPLARLGCRFAIDHFGSGMASFSYIKNLPVQFIKIEGSLVRAMLDSRMDHSLVEAIYRVGHEMGVTTIAEHVERLALLAPLRDIGVDLAQGLAISAVRPFENT